ncbi:MAG: hypothetical protein IJF02_00770 [Oscillospiraceae bacterium]|nr:hypothetical protein [Oscillospiraceae bacterium]
MEVKKKSSRSRAAWQCSKLFYGVLGSDLQRLSKDEWFPAILKSDHVINIHIPDKTNLDMKCIVQSLAEAKALFDSCYPDFKPKAFTCNSWLMDPKLKELLGDHFPQYNQ